MRYYRKNLVVLWVATFFVSASWTQIVPFLPQFVAELGAEERAAEWSGIVFAMHSLSAIVMIPFWGRLADRVGRKPLLVRAGLSLGAIYFLTSVATQTWHLALSRFLNGALAGFIPMAITLISTNTPRELAARYVASVHTGVAVGTVAGPLIGSLLYELFGIRSALHISGAAVLTATIAIIAFVEERHPPTPQEKSHLVGDLRTAIRSPIIPTALLIALVGAIGQMGPQPILALHLEELVGGPAGLLTGIAYALPGIALVVSSRAWVTRSEKRGALPTAIIALCGGGIAYIVLGSAASPLLFVVLYFVSSLFVASLRPISAATIAADVDPDFRGRAFGLQTSAFTLGGLIGPLFAGALGGEYGYRVVFITLGCILLLASLLMVRGARKRRTASSGTDRMPPRESAE